MTKATGPTSEPTPAPRQRVLTLPLVVFLVGVLLVLGYAARLALVPPTAAQAIVLLADGDADAEERQRLLRILVQQGQVSPSIGERWAGAVAAVALEDRDGLAAVRHGLGDGDVLKPLPASQEREFLHLGDPLLGNLAAAWLAEAAGDREAALMHWRQLAGQCWFVLHPLAAELAAAGVQRTG